MVVINAVPGPQGPQGPMGNTGPTGPFTTPFSLSGSLAVVTGTVPWIVPQTMSISAWIAAVTVAPTGSAIIIDIIKNGVSVYTNRSNRPTIPIGNLDSNVGPADVVNFTQGDRVTCDINQVGSTVSGSNLGVSPVQVWP